MGERIDISSFALLQLMGCMHDRGFPCIGFMACDWTYSLHLWLNKTATSTGSIEVPMVETKK